MARPKRKKLLPKPVEADEPVVPIDVYMDQERIELIQQLADQLAERPSWAADLEARLETLDVKLAKDQKQVHRRIEEFMEPLAGAVRRLREETSERLVLLDAGVSALRTLMEAERVATLAALRTAGEDRVQLREMVEPLHERPNWAEDLLVRVDSQAAELARDQNRALLRAGELLEPIADEARRFSADISERLGEVHAQITGLTESLEAERVTLQQALREAREERAQLRELVETLAERQREQEFIQKTNGSELLDLAKRLARPWYRRLFG